MAQLGYRNSDGIGTIKHLVGVSTDDFCVLTVSAGTLTSFKVGERITGGTSGATARVSGVISATEMRVKGVKPMTTTGALFTAGEVITGITSTATATLHAVQATAFVIKKKQLRNDVAAPTLTTGNITFAAAGTTVSRASGSWNTDGFVAGAQFIVSGAVASSGANNKVYTVSSVTSDTIVVVTPAPINEGPVAVTTKALRYNMSFDVVTDDEAGHNVAKQNGLSEALLASKLFLSKTQGNSDAAVAPTLTYVLPADATYADGEVLTFRITSNEMLVVTGAPRISINTLGDAETVYATFDRASSTPKSLVFKYTLDDTATTAGQIASVAYNANGAVIKDAGTSTAVTVSADLGSASVTGIILA